MESVLKIHFYRRSEWRDVIWFENRGIFVPKFISYVVFPNYFSRCCHTMPQLREEKLKDLR